MMDIFWGLCKGWLYFSLVATPVMCWLWYVEVGQYTVSKEKEKTDELPSR